MEKNVNLDTNHSEADDALDSFMSTMKTQDAESKMKKIAFSLRLTEEQVQQTMQLLDVADPNQEHRNRFLVEGKP
jgi:hypothetical protein